MKTAVLHIGSPKTGTTHLQNLFHGNRQRLAAHGIGYPGDDWCHHHLYFVAQRPPEYWPRLFRSMPQEELQRQIESRLAAIVRDLQGSFGTHFLSNEYLFLTDDAAITNVLSFLREYVDRVEVIVFVREPAGHFASAQQQAVKASHTLQHPRDYRYPFRDVIEAWEDRADCVHVARYDPDRDPVETVADLLGLDAAGFARPEARVNASIHVEQMWLLQKIQATFYRGLDNSSKPHLNAIQKLQPKGLTRPKLRPEVRDFVDSNHAADLAWLCERFGIDWGVLEETGGGALDIPDEPGVFDLFDGREAIPEVYESWLIDTLLKQRAN